MNQITDTDRKCSLPAKLTKHFPAENLLRESSEFSSSSMEIPEKLLKFKFHILLALTFGIFVIFLCYIAPRFLDILNYFWPLLVSTVVFLVTVVVFHRISPPSAEQTGEGLLEYVAGEPPTREVDSVVAEAEAEAEVEVEESVKAE